MTGILNLLMGTVRSAGVTADPYFEYTTLLLPGSGTNGAQNNTFLDGSTNNFTITRNGNTTQGTFSPFSQTGWGNYFDGTGDYLTLSPGAAFAFGSGDFTVELFVYITVSAANYYLIDARNASQTTNWFMNIGGTNNWQWYNTSVVLSGGTPVLNQWNHVVYVRSGTTGSLFVNGSRVATQTDSYNYSTSPTTSYIASRYSATEQLTGYISNLRIVKGSAVYDPTQTTLTVPTSPLTAITNTTLLTCQSNRFIDNSTNNFTITRNGNTSVVAFSPFNPTASWSAATYGGSGYFDGSGDYLQGPTNAAFTMGTGDFTIELWYYPIVDYVSGNVYLYDLGSNGTRIQIFNNNVYFLPVAGSSITGTTGQGVLAGAWYHIACVRAGSTITMYLNGSSIGSATNTSNLTDTACRIGAYGGGASNFFNGYMANFRIVKGTAVYTTAFTPPTAPLTAITNTSLLLNFTNAGVYDATSKNDLETVGNAQISNTTAKFGSTSIATGTNNYLKTPDNSLFDLGSGAWTIEFWAYTTAWASSYNVIVCQWNVTTAFIVRITSTLIGLYANIGGTQNYTASVTNSLNNWDYYAITRSGNTLTFYKNNSSVGTASITGTINNSTDPITIGVLGDNNSTTVHSGYIQDLRITLGTARTITAAPTAAFPTL